MMPISYRTIIVLTLLLCLPLLACRWLPGQWLDVNAVSAQATPTATLTPFPTPMPILSAGMTALVQTGGDVLFLRDGPGTTGEILQYLYDDDVVMLLEGPVENGLYSWWRVRTEDGAEGWAAAASGELTTLLPDVPRTATPTPQITFTPQP